MKYYCMLLSYIYMIYYTTITVIPYLKAGLSLLNQYYQNFTSLSLFEIRTFLKISFFLQYIPVLVDLP